MTTQYRLDDGPEPLSHVQAPETRTATALIAVADAWQVEDRRGWENSYRP